MKINNYVWENDLSLNDLVLKQKEKIDELQHQLQQKENIIKGLDNTIENLEKVVEHKDSIIKEVREYIMSELITEWDIENDGYVSGSDLPVDAITPILQILDKEK